jgi:hypothetical protein
MTDRVKFNVGGRVFVTTRTTILKYPKSVLANHIAPPWQPEADGTYFIDRDPDVFVEVLGYYRSNSLERPPHVSQALWTAELDYWGLTPPPERPIRSSNRSSYWPFKHRELKPHGGAWDDKDVTVDWSSVVYDKVQVALREGLNYILIPVSHDGRYSDHTLSDDVINNEITTITQAIELNLEVRSIETQILRLRSDQQKVVSATLVRPEVWSIEPNRHRYQARYWDPNLSQDCFKAVIAYFNEPTDTDN